MSIPPLHSAYNLLWLQVLNSGTLVSSRVLDLDLELGAYLSQCLGELNGQGRTKTQMAFSNSVLCIKTR